MSIEAIVPDHMNKSPGKEVLRFLSGDDFISFCAAMEIVVGTGLTIELLGNITTESYLLTQVTGRLGYGIGFTVVNQKDIKRGEDGKPIMRTKSNAPQLKLVDSEGRSSDPIHQLAFVTSRFDVDEYHFSPDRVVDKSGLYLGIRTEEVSMKSGQVQASPLDTIGVIAHRDGGMSVYQDGKYKNDLSGLVSTILHDSQLNQQLSKIQ